MGKSTDRIFLWTKANGTVPPLSKPVLWINEISKLNYLDTNPQSDYLGFLGYSRLFLPCSFVSIFGHFIVY